MSVNPNESDVYLYAYVLQMIGNLNCVCSASLVMQSTFCIIYAETIWNFLRRNLGFILSLGHRGDVLVSVSNMVLISVKTCQIVLAWTYVAYVGF